MARGGGRRGGRANAELTKLVLETYGYVCHLRFPGCTRVATTKDHLIPYNLGGTDALENFRPACRSCNGKRQDVNLGGVGVNVTVIIGPPAAGKSTYVLAHAQPNDVVIDLDVIARAFMPPQGTHTHVYPDHIRNVAIKARKAAIDSAIRLREPVNVWLIHAIPTPEKLAEYRGLRWAVVTIDPGREVVEARAAQIRPEAMQRQVARWYDTHVDAPDTPVNALTPYSPEARAVASRAFAAAPSGWTF